MKYFAALLLSAVLFVACSDDSSSSVADSPSSDSKIIAIDKSSLDSITDTRDGQSYKIVPIGSQIWTAENINFETENSMCYDGDENNCAQYGRLYTWSAAMTACPSGWHLPSKDEFETLLSTIDDPSRSSERLRAKTGWLDSCEAWDSFAFSALPAGEWYGSFFNGLGYGTFYWSSTENRDECEENCVTGLLLYPGIRYAYISNHSSEDTFAASVRCVKD